MRPFHFVFALSVGFHSRRFLHTLFEIHCFAFLEPEIFEKVYGRDHLEVGSSLSNLTMLYSAIGDTTKFVLFLAFFVLSRALIPFFSEPSLFALEP
jgi:hypothetical protein